MRVQWGWLAAFFSALPLCMSCLGAIVAFTLVVTNWQPADGSQPGSDVPAYVHRAAVAGYPAEVAQWQGAYPPVQGTPPAVPYAGSIYPLPPFDPSQMTQRTHPVFPAPLPATGGLLGADGVPLHIERDGDVLHGAAAQPGVELAGGLQIGSGAPFIFMEVALRFPLNATRRTMPAMRRMPTRGA